MSINNDLMNLNQSGNHINENMNNVSYNELNNLNSQLIKKINDKNFNLNQFNLDEINNANDYFLQNNLSINKNEIRNLDSFNLLDNDNDNENYDFDNFHGNIHIGNVDEIDDMEEDKNYKKKHNYEMGKNFQNKENKFFDFVLDQVQKKNLDKKTKKIKNKKIESLLNDVSSNLANSRIYINEDDFNNNSMIDTSLNLHLNNLSINKEKSGLKKENNLLLDDIKNSSLKFVKLKFIFEINLK